MNLKRITKDILLKNGKIIDPYNQKIFKGDLCFLRIFREIKENFGKSSTP